MTTKTSIAAALPSATQTVLLVFGLIVGLYGTFFTTFAPMIPPQVASILGGFMLVITGALHRGPQIQELANDIAAAKPVAEVLSDLVAVIKGNTAATEANTNIAAAQVLPDPMPASQKVDPAATPFAQGAAAQPAPAAPAVDTSGGA